MATSNELMCQTAFVEYNSFFLGMFRVWRQKYDAEATYLCLADAFESLKRRDQITILLEHFARQKEQCVESGKKSKTVPRLGESLIHYIRSI